MLEAPESEIRDLEQRLQAVRASLEHSKRTAANVQSILAEGRQIVTTNVCPICKRPIPRESLLETIDRDIGELGQSLSELIAQRDSLEASLQRLVSDKKRLVAELETHERRIGELSYTIEGVGKLNRTLHNLRTHELAKKKGLTELPFESFLEACSNAASKLESLQERTLKLSNLVEQLEGKRLLPSKMDKLLESQRRMLAEGRNQELWEHTGKMLDRMSSAITGARTRLVRSTLESYNPLIRALYERLHPHPLFLDIDFEVIQAYKEAELYFRVFTRNREITAYPSTVFSTSQLNALALCIFLALNLRATGSLSVVMMDDPIQVMDDINVLGFCETVRQMKTRRQLFISTHNKELYQLLLNKLRPVAPSDSVKGFRFEAWSQAGPAIREEAVDYKQYAISLEDIKRLAADPAA